MSEILRSLDTVRGINREVEDYLRMQSSVAEHARTALRKGDLVVATEGYYGGTKGLIGSAHRGVRLTQATRPVRLGAGDFVALRHNPEEKELDVVELLALTDDDTKQLATPSSELEVLHEFGDEKGEVSLRTAIKLGNVAMNHRLYNNLDNIISAIDESLEPLEDRSILPRIETLGGLEISSGVHPISNVA